MLLHANCNDVRTTVTERCIDKSFTGFSVSVATATAKTKFRYLENVLIQHFRPWKSVNSRHFLSPEMRLNSRTDPKITFKNSASRRDGEGNGGKRMEEMKGGEGVDSTNQL